ncbi:hypothetical protein [Microbacterium sp. NPDC078849]|uniref:hypothetical protein n=1 Tax=unclassified Microbacterium TaxID=2609290 RepID=UPI00344C8893
MAEEVTEEGASEAAKKLRSRNGVPRVALETIEASVNAIWQVARRGEAAPVTVARAITGKQDAKASGGAWQKRVAALRAFNVIERGSAFKLSPIGIAIANSADVERHTKGLREAVLSIPAYQKFLERADGGELPPIALLASDIEFEYELSNADAVTAANAFVQSARYAGLVDADGHVSLAGVSVPADGAEVDPDAEPDDDTEVESAAAPAGQPAPVAAPAPSVPEIQPPAQPVTVSIPAPAALAVGGSPVTVKVRIDMTEWAADDAVKVLNALGYGEDASESE